MVGQKGKVMKNGLLGCSNDLFLGLGDIYTGVALKWLFKRYVLCTFHNFFNSLWIDRLPITLIYFLWFTSYYFLHFDGERKHLFFYVYF